VKNPNWKDKQNKLKVSIAKLGIDQLLVHADSFKSLNFIDFGENQNENLKKHVELITSLSSCVALPKFNYDFPKNRLFNFDDFSSQTGAISEFFSQMHSKTTFDPMFALSYTSGFEAFSNYQKSIKTFNPSGVFSKFVSEKSGLLLYGAGLQSVTFIHYVEAMADVTYRYEKKFSGHVLFKGIKSNIEFISHFRPMGNHFDYDWKRITDDLIANDLIISLGKYCNLLDMKKLFQFWSQKMKDDHLYFLDKKTVSWVEPRLQKLGRRFERKDFERG
tara:strand:+ start:1380 stop:2204 length:825 start_codon:yes stop_codon:yes gene_type:complete